MTIAAWIAVPLIGALAAAARFEIDARVSARTGGLFPYGILLINVAGAFLLGLLDGLGIGSVAMTLLGTATLGTFTTFSTWMLETQRLNERQQHRAAALNLTATVVLGFSAVLAGHALGKLF